TVPPNSPPAASNPDKQDSAPLSSGTEIARLEDLPKPQRNPGSGLELPLKSPGRAIEESLRQSQGQSGGPGGASGVEGPLQPNLNTPFPVILSDTRGVDFGPYLVRLLREVRRNWYAVIPESARLGEKGRAVIIFTIQKDGSVPLGQPTLVYSSGRSHLDRPALASIRASQPFPPLPSEFTGPNLTLQFTFLYNLPLDYKGP
ncbi:MAG: TonB family protein, partial [Candidatus Acidiferrales bacterium]